MCDRTETCECSVDGLWAQITIQSLQAAADIYVKVQNGCDPYAGQNDTVGEIKKAACSVMLKALKTLDELLSDDDDEGTTQTVLEAEAPSA